MHQLNRGLTPTCLNNYQHGKNKWRDVEQADKTEIWQHLNQMQQQRCAYCERPIKNENRDHHIEHFRQRSRYPEGTFAWSNLFGSCNFKTSCGKHKDSVPIYPPEELIKPDVEDPEYFLLFLPNGNVTPRGGLTCQEANRANSTIRIFNLNRELRQIRKTRAKPYLQNVEVIADLAIECNTDDWQQLLEQEIAATEHLPFATAIKHSLRILTRKAICHKLKSLKS